MTRRKSSSDMKRRTSDPEDRVSRYSFSDSTPLPFYTHSRPRTKKQRRRGSRSVRFESGEEDAKEERDDDHIYDESPSSPRSVPYPEPSSYQQSETIRMFQDLRRKQKRKKHMAFLPGVRSFWRVLLCLWLA